MGLDQYAMSRYIEEPSFTWRKHPNLQGWMERLWASRGNEGTFNTVQLNLGKQEIEWLRRDIEAGDLAGEDGDTEGYFFGDNADEYYKEQDLAFCDWALKEIKDGKEVIYDSWW